MIVGTIGIIIMMVIVCLGLPIAVSLFLVGFGGLLLLVGFGPTFAASAPMLYNYIAKYEFSVIPMFIFMGNIGFYSGLFNDIFDVARKWIGRIPAGLAVSVVVAQCIFGACSGSSVAACVVIGKASYPFMKKAGYPDYLSTGVIAGTGTLAMLIPPSISICIFGLLVDQSIGRLLIGGVIPGLLSGAIFSVILIIWSGKKVPRDLTRYSFKEKISSLRYLWVVVVLIFAIIGGIYSGVCTPTEAAAFGTFAIFLMALFARRLGREMMWKSIRSTISATGMILIIIIAAVLFARFLTLSGFSRGLSEWVTTVEAPLIVIFSIMVVIYLVLGCFVGSTGMMVMTLPTFYPLAMALGWDPVWFGIEVVILCEIAVMTPPVGVNLYATKSIAPGVPLTTVIRGVMPFVYRDIGIIYLLYFFPQIVTFLPNLMMGK